MISGWTRHGRISVVDQEPILTEAQFAKLNNLAFQAAVTKICDGYDLDQTKFAEGVSDATYPAPRRRRPRRTS